MSYDDHQNAQEEECSGAGLSGNAKQEANPRTQKTDSPKGRKGPLGFIYFIATEDQRFVKIGYSVNPSVRVSQLQTGPLGLRLVGCVPGTHDVEVWLHRIFIDDRENGEWFRYTNHLHNFVEILLLCARIEPPIAESGESASEPAAGDEAHCLRCGHLWIIRIPGRPKYCPNCKQARWDRPVWDIRRLPRKGANK